jgi:hypothetical protein
VKVGNGGVPTKAKTPVTRTRVPYRTRGLLRRDRGPKPTLPDFVNFHAFYNAKSEVEAARRCPREERQMKLRALEEKRRAFEISNGVILEETWTGDGGGVVLTVNDHPTRTGLRHQQGRALHHRTSTSLVQRPRLSALERRLTALAAKTHDAVEGLPRTILLDQIYCEFSSLFEHARDTSAFEDEEWAKTENGVIDRLERDYAEAATRSAQVDYIRAMGLGWLGIIVIGATIWGIWQVVDVAVTSQLFFAALLAGGLGACVSVLIRMSSGQFRVRSEPSRSHTKTLGALRPAIGAAFGVVVYFMGTAGILQVAVPDWDRTPAKATAWVFAMAFFAGFSERFAKDVTKAAEDSVGAAGVVKPQSEDGRDTTA